MTDKVKIGDIFVCSWGYEQTNVDFFKCVGFTPCFMKYVKVATEIVDTNGSYADYVAPGKKIGNVVFKAKIKSYGNGFGFAPNSYSWASKWLGEPVYQTAKGWGH